LDFNKFRNGGDTMEEIIFSKITKGLNRREKIIIKVFTKTFVKVYHNTRIYLINSFIK
jgi:hypothetical protein